MLSALCPAALRPSGRRALFLSLCLLVAPWFASANFAQPSSPVTSAPVISAPVASDQDAASSSDSPKQRQAFMARAAASVANASAQAGQVRYFPRAGQESRMVGGQFQGSTDNSTWTTLYTVTAAPSDVYTTAATSADPATFRYLRYLAPDGSYGNVAEIEFDSGGVKLTGTPFGTPGSYANSGNDYTKVFDGDTTTYFDAPYPGNGDYAGIDQGAGGAQVRFAPRAGFGYRMVSGQFQGSSDNSTWTTLATVTVAPPDNQYSTLPTSADPATFRYLRYLAPDGSYGNVAEIEFDSGGVKLTGTTFGTPGSYANDGDDYTKVFDGDTTTFLDAPYPGNGDYAGIDQGPSAQVGQVRYFPRVGLESRMVGGQFQGSNDNSTWTTFYTVTTTPGDTYTTAPITSGPRIFRYLRYLAPDGSYGNVAEIEFDSGTGSNAVKLTGTLFGTPGSNANSGNDYTKVFDGDTTTFFDALYPGNGDYAGIDQGLHLPPVGDVPPPGWAEEVIPSDSSDAGGNGPSASLSVSLPSGVLENHPGPDLDVYNPTGPSISYARLYRSALAASGTYTPGLSPGWRDNYSLTITSSGGGSYTLNYPNGGAENWTTVSGTITPPSGVPYLVNASGSALVMTFKDHSYYTFTPSPSNASLYLLTGLSNLAGSTVTINRDSTNGNRITTFTNGGANPLLTLNYSGSGLANITDLYGRVVTYTFTASNLATVSQVNAASAIRWQYGYTTINAQPFLSAVMVPDPSSASISEADPQYAPGGYVTSLKDAEGNLRAYSYGPNAVSISIYGPNNALSQSWTQKFDPANHNVDMGIVDAFGHSTSLTYGDAANPLKVTAATNKNGQTATASFDKYGNTMAVSDLRSVTTQNSYDPAFLLGQVAQIQVGINQPTPKTPTNFTYYDGTTQVNGVTQAKGLMKTTSVPTPGTTGTGAQVTSTYVYTALGNAAQVVSPGPSTGGGTVTTTYNYTTDALYDGNGNAIQAGAPAYTAAEQLKQPLTVTDPLGNVTHYRYDARGNPIIVITAPVVSYPDTTIARGLRTDYAYNSQDQLTGIMYPALNPSTPTFRNSTIYAYEYVGGPLLTITELDQSNTVVRQTNVGKGKEDEQKAQAGSIQQANFSYDPQYRLKQLTDGNSNPAQKYSFDGVGNLTSKTYALGDGPQFTQYDNDNNLLQMKDGRGVTTTYTRAADDSRVTGVTYSDGTAAVNLGASGYDVYDRVTSYSDGVGSYTVSYDDDDNLLSKTTAYAGLPAATVSYSYNYDGSRATLTTPKALSGSTYSYWTFSYGYDSDGQVTSLTCPWAKSSTSTGLAVLSYYYDELGRMIKQHTQKGDTYYVYNSRGWLAQQQSANTYFPASFTDPNTNENNNTGRPLAGNIPNRTAQGQSVTGDLSYVLLDDYSNMQYDAVGNRLSMTVFLPDFYIYDSSGNYTSYPPLNKTFGGTLTYAYDIKDRLTLETTNNSSGTPTFNDYALSGGAELYNDNWNYQINADLADNLTTLRGNTQTFNADDQLTSQTYDGAGDRTSYDGGSVLYDANGLPISVPGNNGATPFTQTFTGEGDRAWKLPSGGSKTYYLYDGDALLMELSSTGAPVTTYAYGPSGLLERFQHTNAGVPYVLYLFDPNGSLVHRVRSIDPNVTSGAAVFVQDTALYDSTGLLHADIDTLSGGFNSGHLDPIGYKGELGNYTDLETQQAVAGLYTALSGPGGASYYDPMTGVGMARDQADSANEYSDNLNSLEPALHRAFVDVTGLLPGPIGSAGAGLIDGEITYIETGNAKEALVRGGTTAGIGLAFGKAGHLLGGPLSSALASRVSEEAAPVVSGAVSDLARKGCFVAGTPVQMADGSTKPIEQIKAGDFVKSRNPETGVTEAKRVLQTTVRQTSQVLTLSLTDPKTGRQEQITTTGEHPFYVDGRGFVKAGDLGIGTSIVTRAGPCLTLSHITWAQEAPAGGAILLDGKTHLAGYTVYNLIVEGDHTYFVGTTGGGAWVHNVDCPIPTGLYKDIAGHHIHAQAGFDALGSRYDGREALTVSEAEINTWGGASHTGTGSMTSKQAQLYAELRRDIAAGTRKNTLNEHDKIAIQVLMHGGLSEDNARILVIRSLRNLRGQGIRAPNRIVGSNSPRK